MLTYFVSSTYALKCGFKLENGDKRAKLYTLGLQFLLITIRKMLSRLDRFSTVLGPSLWLRRGGSTTDDLGVLDPFSGVAGIDDQLSFPDDPARVGIGVVGHDKTTVILSQVLQLSALHLQVVFAAFADKRE